MRSAWAGWSIDTRHGDLVTPVGECIRPGHVLSLPYRLQQLGVLQRQLAEYKDTDADRARATEDRTGQQANDDTYAATAQIIRP